MPRDGAGVYTRPTGIDAVPDTTIESAKYNTNVQDVEADLNLPRPIVAGGTGANSAVNAMTNLSGETAKQVVTNWDATTWKPGSFYAATSASGAAPVAGHAFAGIAYYANTSDFVCEATDLTDPANPITYTRIMAAGVWGAWSIMGGSGTVRYDKAQTLTAAQQAQARSNTGVTKKNYIINGGMMISQENGATAGTAAGASYYPVDQFYAYNAASGTSTIQQVTAYTPSGSVSRLRVTATAADATVAATDQLQIGQKIEGSRSQDLMFGTTSAKTITIAFGVKAPAGTYCLNVANSAANRAYVSEYVIAAGEANTDVRKSVTVPGDTAGSWLFDNNAGIILQWVLVAGSSFQQTPNAWGTTANAMASSNQSNFMSTNSNVFELFDVGLYEGTVAPPFQVPDYASELTLCQRYWRTNILVLDANASAAAVTLANALSFSPPMRIAPNIAPPAPYFSSNISALNVVGGTASTVGAGMQATSLATGRAYYYGLIQANARL